jgi:tetratricopeptide (TPR) repeat protein
MKRLVAALILVAVAGGPARAETCDAKQHYDRATAAYGLSRFGDAAGEFEKAYECKPQAPLLFDAAQAHRQAGNRQRALALFENYLHVYGRQAVNGADVQRIVDQLRTETAPPVEPTPAPVPQAATTTTSEGVVATAPAPAERKPLYKRGWFWGAVAGGAVVVGGVIALSVVYGTSTKNPMPSVGTWAP